MDRIEHCTNFSWRDPFVFFLRQPDYSIQATKIHGDGIFNRQKRSRIFTFYCFIWAMNGV